MEACVQHQRARHVAAADVQEHEGVQPESGGGCHHRAGPGRQGKCKFDVMYKLLK